MSTAIATTPEKDKRPKGMLALLGEKLEEHKSQIAAALPRHLTPERMIRIALTAVSRSELLQKCTWTSVAGCVVQASILGWEPNTLLGESYLIPFWNSKLILPGTDKRGGYECQLQPGYQGLLKLCHNSGQIATVGAEAVHENDFFEYEMGFDPYFKHVPARSNRGAIIDYYAFSKTLTGGKYLSVWTVEEIEAHRDKYSQSAYKKDKGKLVLDSNGNKILQGPWKDSPHWMYAKTPLKNMMKLLPKSSEMQQAQSLDERSEAGIPQKFSFDVPLELHPFEGDGEEDPKQIEAVPTDGPRRKSELKIVDAEIIEPDAAINPELDAKNEKMTAIAQHLDRLKWTPEQGESFFTNNCGFTTSEVPAQSLDALIDAEDKLSKLKGPK